MHIAPGRTSRQALQPIDARSVDGRKALSTPASGVRIAEERSQRRYIMGDTGPLQLAPCDCLNMRRNIVESDLVERLVLAIDPGQKLCEIPPMPVERARSQATFVQSEPQKGSQLRSKWQLQRWLIQSPKQPKPLRRVKHKLPLSDMTTRPCARPKRKRLRSSSEQQSG